MKAIGSAGGRSKTRLISTSSMGGAGGWDVVAGTPSPPHDGTPRLPPPLPLGC